MKRALSLFLAVALMAGMAAVSLAAPMPVLEGNSSARVDSIGEDFFKYSSDNAIMNSSSSDTATYGNTIYYPLLSEDGYLIAEPDAVKGVSIKTRWENNGDYVASVDLARMKAVSGAGGYGYFLAVKFISSAEASSTDVIGDITLKKSSGDYKFETKLDVNLPLRYTGVTVSAARDIHVIYDTKYLYDFDGTPGAQDEEFEFTFDDIEDAYFTVNTIGQGDLILAADGDYNTDITSKHPTADIDFFNGNGASFNKVGTLFIPADADSFLYEVRSNGALFTVPGAEYDEYDEGFLFKTRTLGTYIVSDEQLPATEVVRPAAPEEPDEEIDEEIVDEGSDVDSEAPVNPSTGAAV